MKHLKYAYSPKAMELFGVVADRDQVCICDTDFTDVSAVIITDLDEDVQAKLLKHSAFRYLQFSPKVL